MSEAKDSGWIDGCVRALQAGERHEECCERLYGHYRSRVEKFFRRVFGPEDAPDLTQECLFRVFKSIGEFRGESTFTTWVYKVARNLYLNEYRRRRALMRGAPEVSLDAPAEFDDDDSGRGHGLAERFAAGGRDPEEEAAAAELRRHLGGAVSQLPDRMRKVVVLRFGHGLKYREIASALDIQIDTVKSQLHYAKQRLEPMLADTLDPPDD